MSARRLLAVVVLGVLGSSAGCGDGAGARRGAANPPPVAGHVPPVADAPRPELPAPDADHGGDRPRSRLVQAMLQALDDRPLEGTREERQYVRRALLEADAELYRSTHGDPIERIRAVNQGNGASPVRRLTPQERPERPAGSAPAGNGYVRP